MNASTLTSAAAAAATVAALAGTVQAYVSWSGRNDVLKATLVAATVQKCSDLSFASQKYLDNFDLQAKYMEAGRTPPAEQVDDYKAWLLLEEKMVPVQFALSILEPSIQPELATWLDPINGAMEKYYSKPANDRTLEDVKGMRDAALKLIRSTTNGCEKIIRKHIG